MRSQKETFVYVVLELPLGDNINEKQGYIKIGRTIDIERRIKQFELCTPREFEVIDLYGPFQHGKAKKLEKDLHTLCREFQVKGEWFHKKAIRLIKVAMEKDIIMDIFEKQDIQNELALRLQAEWVLSKVDLVVTDKNLQPHVLDVALHTGDYVFGRITVGSLSRIDLDGVEEIQCTSHESIDRCVEIAVALQERHCKGRVIMQSNGSHMERAVA